MRLGDTVESFSTWDHLAHELQPFMRAHLRTRALSSHREGNRERLPARPCASTEAKAKCALIRTICSTAKLLFRCQGVSYWQQDGSDDFTVQYSEGEPHLHRGQKLYQEAENLFLAQAMSRNCVCPVNREQMGSFGFGAARHVRAGLLVPARFKNGTKGFLLLAYSKLARRSIVRMKKDAAIFAGVLPALFDGIRHAARPDSSELRAQSLMDLAVELKPSLRLTEFAGRFTVRAEEMLGARAAILALARGERLETIIAHDSRQGEHHAPSLDLDHVLTQLATEHRDAILSGGAPDLLGPALARTLGWRNVCMARLSGREGDLLGVLCLADRSRELDEADRNLIHALAGHASVALENSRLFSRIEQSKRHWVEDFDAITDFIVSHDPSSRILRANRSLAEALGTRPSELIGKSMRALNAIAGHASDPACPFCHEAERSKEEFILTAGARAFLVSTSRIGAEEGSRSIHVLKDITEQRNSQAQLQRERNFNQKILNHTQSMILVLDTAGLISYANRRCYEAGFRREDLLGHPLLGFVRRDRSRVLEMAFQNALEGLASENLELPFLRGNRSSGQYSVSLSPMRDEQGHVNSVVVVMTDITDAAVLQAQLRHSEKMAALGQLVSGVAHEINNPLAAIVGYSDLLLENSRIPRAAKEELRIVLKEAERTRDIVQNLLRFARQMPSRRESLDVRAILEQVVQLRTYGGASNGVEIIERASGNLPRIMGDAQQLQQVFLNILNNAHDAVRGTGCTGRIEISTNQRNGFVEIAIRDNGTGVSDTEKIFEPFYTTKELGKGTGLGLSICYGIVREHGGEVHCANNSDGPGCTFFVRLPVAGGATAASGADAS
jgi:two-component system, NtrC family, sensor kinase